MTTQLTNSRPNLYAVWGTSRDCASYGAFWRDRGRSGELVRELEIPQSRASNHLACLKWCGYVSSERDGRNVIYRVTDERVREVLRLTRAIVGDNAERIASCVRIPDR